MLSLPENLERAVGEIIRTIPTTQWASEAQKLSRRYRGSRDELPKSFAPANSKLSLILHRLCRRLMRSS